MEQAIQAVDHRGFDVMILTKMNISMTEYCRNQIRYDVTCLKARPSCARESQGGVRLVTREKPVGW